METNIYALLGYDSYPHKLKKSSSARIDSIVHRGSASSAKINTMKIKQKAKDLEEMRSVPVINQNSRRIAEGMKRERLDLVTNYESKHEAQALQKKSEIYEPVRISVNILKSLEKIEKSPVKPEPKFMNVQERTKYWQDQKEKKLKEQRKAKEEKELDGCTFKPKKAEIQDFEIVNRPNSLKTEQKKKPNSSAQAEKPLSTRDYPHGHHDSAGAEGQYLSFFLKGKDSSQSPEPKYSKKKQQKSMDLYKGLSPAINEVRIKPGFLSELAKPKRK